MAWRMAAITAGPLDLRADVLHPFYMPSMRPSADRYKNYRLCQAAADGMLVTLRCPVCRRAVHFWAKDLMLVLDKDHEMYRSPFSCSKCRTPEIDVRWRIPSAEELSKLIVRRPVRKVERWIWQNVPA